jgi:peptidoglycan-N-acetylglucosamine deacetylase
VLDLLARHGAKATFFLAGSEVERFPELARRLVAEGHAIGSHTAAHLDHEAVEAEVAVADMLAGVGAIARVLGFEPGLYRAPYGHFVPATLAEATARSVADHVLEALEPGAIVLLHDSRRAKPKDPEPVIGATAILLQEIEGRGLRAVSLAAML